MTIVKQISFFDIQQLLKWKVRTVLMRFSPFSMDNGFFSFFLKRRYVVLYVNVITGDDSIIN